MRARPQLDDESPASLAGFAQHGGDVVLRRSERAAQLLRDLFVGFA